MVSYNQQGRTGLFEGQRMSFEVAAFFKVRQGRIIKIHELIVELT